MEVIKFSDNVVVYKLKYDWSHSKESILNRLKQNEVIVLMGDLNTRRILLNCPEFNSIKKMAIDTCKILSNNDTDVYLNTNWVYVQDPEHYIEGFHRHLLMGDYSIVGKNEWTFCFYLQIPPKDTLNGDEGKILFKDDNGDVYDMLPEEGDLLIFRHDLYHCPKLTPNAKMDRISICGNVSFKIEDNHDYKDIR